jgi:hypothetical protein
MSVSSEPFVRTPAPAAEREQPIRRRRARAAVVAAVVAAFVLGLGGTASAALPGVGTSRGMQCDQQNGWVRQNWPNISVRTAARQDVYFMVTLQQYTTAGWRSLRNSTWYHGVSDVRGSQPLGNFGGQPYFFSYQSGTASYVGPERGPVFLSLPYAYYRTIETFWVGGTQWSQYSYDAYSSTGSSFCIA